MKDVAAFGDDTRAPLTTDGYEKPFQTYQGRLPDLDRKGLFKRLFNAKTQDFLIGAAVTGSLSYATRIGVLGAATAAGAAALPAALAAGAATGLVVGSVRFYREYKKEGYDLNDPETRKKFYKQLLVSSALSTVGGGMGYSFVHHYDQIAGFVQQTGVPAWISRNLSLLANTPAGLAVANAATPAWQALAEFAGSAKASTVDAYHAMPSVATMVENTKSFAGKTYESMASFAAKTYDSLPSVSAVAENAKQSVKGWWRSAMNAVGLSQDTPVAQASQASMTGGADSIVADNNVTIVEKTTPDTNVTVVQKTVPDTNVTVAEKTVPVADTSSDEIADLPVHTVKTVKVMPDGMFVTDAAAATPAIEVPEVQTLAPLTSEDIKAQTVELPKYVQEYFARPKGMIELPKQPLSFAGQNLVVTHDGLVFPAFDEASIPKYLPKLTDNFEIHSWPDHYDVMTSGITPDNAAEAIAALPSSPTIPMKDQLSTYFEGKDLSRRAERAVEKAMSGDLQAQKDLAMKLLNGQGGFAKDPAMAAKLYDNVIAEGTVEGKRPRGAVFQAMMDKAWMQFHGKGIPADPEAAKETLRGLAKFNSGARNMLAEWTGEKVRHAASVSKETVASVKGAGVHKAAGAIAKAKGSEGLSCDWLMAGKKVISGTCNGDLGSLKVGDKITLNP